VSHSAAISRARARSRKPWRPITRFICFCSVMLHVETSILLEVFLSHPSVFVYGPVAATGVVTGLSFGILFFAARVTWWFFRQLQREDER
jgi:hypothetical protein